MLLKKGDVIFVRGESQCEFEVAVCAEQAEQHCARWLVIRLQQSATSNTDVNVYIPRNLCYIWRDDVLCRVTDKTIFLEGKWSLHKSVLEHLLSQSEIIKSPISLGQQQEEQQQQQLEKTFVTHEMIAAVSHATTDGREQVLSFISQKRKQEKKKNLLSEKLSPLIFSSPSPAVIAAVIVFVYQVDASCSRDCSTVCDEANAQLGKKTTHDTVFSKASSKRTTAS